jgi:hypothetical protein
VDSAYGFSASPSIDSYQRYLQANDSAHRWERLASHQPALTAFWYRQHQNYLQPVGFLSREGLIINGLVTAGDPPMTERGMVRIILNAKGRLEYLEAMPSLALSQTAAGQTMDWSSLLSAAGLETARFTPAPPEAFLPVYADSRMAWTGSYDPGRPDKIRVEAAALNGRPVFFRILGPWEEPEIAAKPRGRRFGNIFGEVLLVTLMIAAGLTAWRNVRQGRGDRKAAWRVAAVLFASGVASWALVSAHVPTLWELYLLLVGLSWAAFQAGFVGLLYLAVEPFVRRHWPDALISWMRIISGRFRDPLVTSNVLVGACAGTVLALLNAVNAWATNGLMNQPGIGVEVSGARFFFGSLLSRLNGSAFVAIGYILVLVLLRSVGRRTWVADVLFVVLLSLLNLVSPASIPAAVLILIATVWVLRRFGLLALVVMTFAGSGVVNSPLVAASWYAPLSLATPLLVVAVAAWSLYVILASRPGVVSRPVT